MRILFTTIAEHSHILAQTPMAWALTTAGHEVRLASAPAMTEVTTAAGLTAVPVGTDHNLHELLASLSAQGTGSIENELSDWSEPFPGRHSWQNILLKYQVSVPMAMQSYNDPIVDELVEFAKAWRPDLVIWDPLTYAGAVAATVIGVPHARLLWSADIYGEMRKVFNELRDQQPPAAAQDPLADWLGRQLELFGSKFDETVVTGHFTIDPMPNSVQLPFENRVPVRYTPYNGESSVPKWVWEGGADRPRVVVTSGSSFEDALGATFLPFADVLAGLADQDVEVITTISDAEKEKIGTLPDNVRSVGFVPMQALLPTCSAIVHHGGFGSWSNAAVLGVPQLITTIRHGDLWLRAGRTEEMGAGLRQHGPSVTPESAGEAVARLIGDSSFQAGAAKLREEILAMPTPNEVVPEIERLTALHRAG